MYPQVPSLPPLSATGPQVQHRPSRHHCPDEHCAGVTLEVDRYVLESIDGPVEDVVVACAAGHRFHGAVSSLWQDGAVAS